MDNKFNHQLSLVFTFLGILIEYLTEDINANLVIIILATIIAAVTYYMVARIIIKVIESLFKFIIRR
jgi:uncharacterized membrane protein